MRRRLRTEATWLGGAWVTNLLVRYVYDGNLVIQERQYDPRLSTTIPQRLVSYTRGRDLSGSREGAGGIGGLLARTDATASQQATSFYHSDGNGNVAALADANGTFLGRYWYDPFGNTIAVAGAAAEANLYRFSTKEWHQNSGLLYYLYRYYEPSFERWVNRDPIAEAGDLNLYRFARNGSVHLIDPLGLRDRVAFPKDCGSIDNTKTLGQALDSLRRDYKNWRNNGYGDKYRQARDGACNSLRNMLDLLDDCCGPWSPQQEKYFKLVRTVLWAWCTNPPDPPGSQGDLMKEVKDVIKEFDGDLGIEIPIIPILSDLRTFAP